MAQNKSKKKAEEEALKHYIPDEELVSSADLGPDEKRKLDQFLESKPKFIKAIPAIDRIMAKRKSPVIKAKKGNKKP
jgi:hypothetical protein